MNFDFFQLTNQVAVAHWSWTIALFLWLVGLGGMGLFVNMWARSKTIFYICTVSGIIGTLLVVSHLSRITNLPSAAINAMLDGTLNLGSWMFIGICILGIFCVWTFFQCLYLLGILKTAGFQRFLETNTCFVINGILGLFATAYSGFLLTQAHGISLWTTAMIPTIWVVSGLSCSLGLIEFLIGIGNMEYGKVHWITKTGIVADCLEAIAIFAFLLIAFSGDAASGAGAYRMVYGEGAVMFWGGAIVLGIGIPLLVNLIWPHNLRAANVIGGACGVIGALFLRASILMAGYYAPVVMS